MKVEYIKSKAEFFEVTGLVTSKNATETLKFIDQRCVEEGGDQRLLLSKIDA